MDDGLGVGAEVDGYRVEREIGRGGMGVVYLATQERLGRSVALKLISPERARDPAFRDRFVRESRLAATIEHPNAVPVYGAGEHDDGLFIAMRYVEGSDLRALLSSESWLEPRRAAALVEGVAGALDEAHRRGLVHRDVKPANILIGEVGGREWPYLTDFGLTKPMSGTSGLTETGEWIGTLDYASPEQIEGRALDARSDVYSLGCVLYEALAGRIPFERDDQVAKLYAHVHDSPPPLREIAPDVPEALSPVVERALAKDPDERFPSAGDLGRAAVAAAGGEAVTVAEHSVARGEAATGVLARSRPGRRTTLALVAGSVALLAAIVAVLALSRGGDGGGSGPQVVATIPVGEEPLALDAGEGAVWVANSGDDTITGIDPATGESGEQVAVGARPAGVSAAGGSVWVANSGEDTVTRLEPNGVSGGEIAVGHRPSGIRAGLGRVWVANVDAGTVSGIEPGSGSAGPEIQVGAQPSGVALSGNSVWVANSGDGNVTQIASNGQPVATIPVGPRPRGVAVGSDFIWVANSLNGSVSQIDPVLGEVKNVIQVGKSPAGVAVGEDGVWVANEGDGTVSRIDPDSAEVTDVIEVGDSPRGVTVGDGSVWVANSGDDTVSRIDP